MTAVDPARPAPRCADTARLREDPPLGTAPLTSRWLLIEHPGPWRTDAFVGAGLPGAVHEALSRAAHAVRGRVLLIRRPGRAAKRDQRAWAVSIGGLGSVWGRWREPHDLLAAGDVLRSSSADLEPSPYPLLLVCTHGVHDACCAIRGRPLAAALAERWPEPTWECSHVGGCRFAANVIVLPEGAYYGNLEPARAVQVIEEQLAGRVALDHLRGLARHPPVAQAAFGEAHARWGPFAAHEVQVRRIVQTAADSWEIDVILPARPAVRMTVRTSARPPASLTCRAPRATSAVGYSVTSVQEVPGAPLT